MKPSRLWIWKLATWWLPETRFFGFKAALLRWCGAKVGKNVRMVSGVEIVGNGSLVIGDDVFIGAGTRIVSVSPAEVFIGNCIDIAPQVMILTGSHEINVFNGGDASNFHVAGKGTATSVKIGDGCWLCARSVILPGVEVAARTLVAAGALVAKSVKESGLKVGGVPAVKL